MEKKKYDRFIHRKETELKRCELEIYKLNDEIKKVSTELKDKRYFDRTKRVAEMRTSNYRAYKLIDMAKRPSDRSFDTKIYSRVEKDTWTYENMRTWYNKYAIEEEKYQFSPIQTGYRLLVDDNRL